MDDVIKIQLLFFCEDQPAIKKVLSEREREREGGGKRERERQLLDHW